MQQGSNLAVQQDLNAVSITRPKQVALINVIVEVNGLCGGIQNISQLCINEGHVTADQIEDINALASIMRQHLTVLRLEVSEDR